MCASDAVQDALEELRLVGIQLERVGFNTKSKTIQRCVEAIHSDLNRVSRA